ncbi:MAG: Lipopolysaccharide-assembly, LptC-related [Candidatus Eremiobacteraeota bacterium]|nr:Lipopolysaccharide-assembly, LptC-related [Candidatus Eremiobacteraeota bacterium]
MPRRAAAALVLVLVAGLAGCAHGPARSSSPAPAASSAGPAAPSPAPSASATALPIRVVTRGGSGKYVTIVQSVRGRKVYTVRALSSVAERGPSGQTVATLEQPHVTFVDRAGATTIADAPKAQVTERDKSVVMTGGVRATTSQGNVLTCDQLTYNGSTEKLRGEGHVKLASPNGFELGGDHLAGDVRLQNVRITSGAGR